MESNQGEDMLKRISVILLILTTPAWAQGYFKSPLEKLTDKGFVTPMAPLYYFLGEWTGEEKGAAGVGKGERKYEFVIKDVYLHFKNRSVFEPQEKNPEGEVHEDWGFFSFDKKRSKIILRQFHGEGFVNQYTLDSVTSDRNTIILNSESIENGPDGMRARYIYTALNDNEFEETFELAMPGKELKPILTNRWKRKVEK